MIGRRRISRRWPNAAIFFADQIVIAKIFRFAVAPFFTDTLVQALSERFSQPVCKGLGHDRVVVVMIFVELFGQFVAAQAGSHGKRS